MGFCGLRFDCEKNYSNRQNLRIWPETSGDVTQTSAGRVWGWGQTSPRRDSTRRDGTPGSIATSDLVTFPLLFFILWEYIKTKEGAASFHSWNAPSLAQKERNYFRDSTRISHFHVPSISLIPLLLSFFNPLPPSDAVWKQKKIC